MDGNIPCYQSYGVFTSQLDRFFVLILVFVDIFRMLRNWLPNSSTKDLIKLHCAIDLIDFVRVKLVLGVSMELISIPTLIKYLINLKINVSC